MYGKNAVFLLNVRKFQQQEPLEGGLRPICYEQIMKLRECLSELITNTAWMVDATADNALH